MHLNLNTRLALSVINVIISVFAKFWLCGCLVRGLSSPMGADLESSTFPKVSSLSSPSPDPLPPPLPLPLNLTAPGNGQDGDEFVPVRTEEGNHDLRVFKEGFH